MVAEDRVGSESALVERDAVVHQALLSRTRTTSFSTEHQSRVDALRALRVVRGANDEVPQQRGLDREHRVRVEVGALRVEDMGRDFFVARSADDHVEMRRPPRVASGRLEHVTDRAVVGDRVRHGTHPEEGVGPVVARAEAPAQMILRRIRVLDRVEEVGVVLPDVELGAGDRGAVDVEHPPVDPGGQASRLLDDAVAVLAQGRAREVEGPEHRRLRRAGRLLVGDRVDDHREPERVGPEDELLATLVCDVAGLGQDPDRRFPLGSERRTSPRRRADAAPGSA